MYYNATIVGNDYSQDQGIIER